jgi:hypothetical protein
MLKIILKKNSKKDMIRNGSKLRGEGVIANQAVLGKNICKDARL